MSHIETLKNIKKYIRTLSTGFFEKKKFLEISNSFKEKTYNDDRGVVYPHDFIPSCESLSKEQVVQMLHNTIFDKRKLLEENEHFRNRVFSAEIKLSRLNKLKLNNN